MGCSAICSSKNKTKGNRSNFLTQQKLEVIERWIDEMDVSEEIIDLPTNPPDKPKIISNQDERKEFKSTITVKKSSAGRQRSTMTSFSYDV